MNHDDRETQAAQDEAIENEGVEAYEIPKARFGAWTGQVKAVAIAHFVVAVVHLSMVFFVRNMFEAVINMMLQQLMEMGFGGEEISMIREGFAEMDWVVPLMIVVIVVFSVLFALNGWKLWLGRNWARINAIVLGVLIIPAFPLGTIVGIWFIYVMVNREVASAFKALSAQR